MILAAGLGAAACRSPQPPPGTSAPVTLAIAIPHGSGDASAQFQTLLAGWSLERLTYFDQHGRPVPRLARKWSTSADGLTWTITLRGDVVFQDGSPLTNVDVASQLREAAADPGERGNSVCLPDVTQVTAEGPLDVVVRLNRRCYYLLDDLSIRFARTGPNGTEVGTGPYAVTSSSPAEVTLVANPRYYLGAPSIGRIVARPYDTLRTAWANMMRGEVDFLWEVGPDTAEFLSDLSGVETLSYPGLSSYAILLNASRAPLRDASTRRALSLAVDRQELVRQGLKGHGVPADEPVSPASWAFDRSAPAVPFAPEHALASLASQRTTPVAFTCLLPEKYVPWERVAMLVQRQLRAVGVEMRLEVVPLGTLGARIGSGDFDAVMLNPIGAPFARDFFKLWHSQGALNRWGYRNATVDAALEAMRDARDDSEYTIVMARFVAAIRDDPPALFLVWPNTLQAVSRRFDLPAAASGRDALHSVWAWRLREAGRQ